MNVQINHLNNNYSGQNIQWIEVNNPHDNAPAFIKVEDNEEYVRAHDFIIDFVQAQQLKKLSIQGDASRDVNKMFSMVQRNQSSIEEGNDRHWDKGSVKINQELIMRAVRKRLPSFRSITVNSRNIYLSKKFITKIFKPIIPSTPLVPIANFLSGVRYRIGPITGALLMLPEMLLRSLLNLILNVAIYSLKYRFPVEAELLKLRTAMNYNAPFQTFAKCCYNLVDPGNKFD
jgi:hypothetical protein